MPDPSIGVAATFRDECNALPGFLEMATAFFDDVLLVDCSPDANPSTDGSLDIIRKWGLPHPPCWDLNAGFGAVRTQLLKTSRTDWTVIMDIDERMHVTFPVLSCDGDESYPDVENPKLRVSVADSSYNHRDWLLLKIKEAERTGAKGVRFCRRHWFDTTYRRPTQNWMKNRDWQLRCMKSRDSVGYKSDVKMHETAWDYARNDGPVYVEDDLMRGPFFDHLHCHFKPMEPEQRREDIRVYDALHFSERHTPIPA